MAERNHRHDAIVIRARESPAGDRILTFMTSDSGLVDSFVFGGGKSKLRSIASPYVHGTAYIYADPVKDYRKLSDFEVLESFSGMRESLPRLWGASVVAEMLIRTSGGGGDFPAVCELSLCALRALDSADEASAPYPVILFLWRLLSLIGLGPDPSSCSACGRPLSGAGASSAGSGAFHAPDGEGFLCGACASQGGRDPFRGVDLVDANGWQAPASVSPGALEWLRRADGAPFAAILRRRLDEASLAGLRSVVFSLSRRAAEGPLHTIAGQ